MSTAARAASRWESQRSFDEIGRPLRDITFCVVDLETTGGSPQQGCMITEIGAVKVRGGEVLGEFQTLVNPHTEIPAFIAVLTGISNSMVADAPPIESALPAFLEFAAGCVLVAHNAPFDVGFLKHFAALQERPWPAFEVVDTAKVARRVITRDDAPNCKLSSLARAFHSSTTPNHRALSDARATVDVLHGLMERLGSLGVHTLEELQTFSSRVSAAQRRKRHLADGLPHSPGVYLFKDERSRILYIGTSRDLRKRVRSYFTASESRSRIGEMVRLASTVTGHRVRDALGGRGPRAAADRRAQAELQPTLAVPREGHVRQADPGAVASAVAGQEGARRRRRLPRSVRLPQGRREVPGGHPRHVPRPAVLRPVRRRPSRSPCVLAEMGRCLSPCDGSVDAHTYAAVVRQLRETLLRRPDDVVEVINARMAALAADERFEEAGVHRDRLAAFVRAAARTQRLTSLTRCSEVVAARREDDGRWAVHVIRYGRLAAAGVIPPGADAHLFVTELRATAETVTPSPGPLPAATAEESERILRWLESPSIRLIEIDGEWTCPVSGATRYLDVAQRCRRPAPTERVLTPVPALLRSAP